MKLVYMSRTFLRNVKDSISTSAFQSIFSFQHLFIRGRGSLDKFSPPPQKLRSYRILNFIGCCLWKDWVSCLVLRRLWLYKRIFLIL